MAMAAAVKLGNQHGVGSELALQTGRNTHGPLIRLGLATPEAELTPGGGDEFIRDER